ncbi:hypothetical protein TrLO_g4119 [Triparma laevis f. longispina]|uniref:Uncharacterized protein n=1 Tax=Triparma laevis f. longispina TaxID=1714387 RepID=A0A9W7CBM1_9STRA|nr:hypothetical protein TrLO_g4119 [Triparma laevis f. longispina]
MASRPSRLSAQYSRGAKSLMGEAERRGISPEDFLPMEFFDIREEVSPKAPIKTLVKWGAAVYAFFLVIFVALFTLEITKVTKLSTTTIVNAPSNEGNIVCTPLSTFSGSEDVQCQSSFAFPNNNRFYMENDPYGEGQSGFVTCGTMVRATKDMCDARVAQLDVCNIYAAAIEQHSECRANPGDGSLKYLSWGEDEPKTIRVEISLAKTNQGLEGAQLFNEFGPYPTGASVYSVSENSLSFGLAYQLGRNNESMVTQDTCKVSSAWISKCDEFLQNTCKRVGITSGPYACVETEENKPSFVEALGTAYANLAFLQGLLLPIVAIVMVKMGALGGQQEEKMQQVPPSSPIHKKEIGDSVISVRGGDERL